MAFRKNTVLLDLGARLLGAAPALLLGIGLILSAQAQARPIPASYKAEAAHLFASEPDQPLASYSARAVVHADKGDFVKLDLGALKSHLAKAPLATPGAALKSAPVTLGLPNPITGGWDLFEIVDSPIMEPGLAAKFPDVKTYAGRGITDPGASLRCDITMQGFHAQVLSPDGTYYLDPIARDRTDLTLAYARADLRADKGDFKCLVTEAEQLAASAGKSDGPAPQLNGNLRTFRLALACTGEYATFQGGTVSAVHAAFIVTMNRVNGIYERDLAVHMNLVANNDLLIFTDSATDPYNNSSASSLLSQNQTTCNNIIGNANYDIGHVFSTAGGGLAGLGVVCNTTNKARGETGTNSPVGDGFDVDYVAHEMGHQFGGNHTFNSSASNCGGGNRVAARAYEPGSGVTIMAYAGICTTDNLQPHSIDHFHAGSLAEMNAFLASSTACASLTVPSNTAPTVSAGNDYYIPIGTPFELTASGSDAEEASITYCWEEIDLGPTQAITDPDNGLSPLFRSFSPTTDPMRTFPKLSSILSNTASLGEKLPSTTRPLRFRVTARDNHAGAGYASFDDVQLNVESTAGPFAITNFNTSTSVVGQSQQTVTWDVANTTASPINTSTVNILISLDGGASFFLTVASGTANDGVQIVTIPNFATTQARFKVIATNSVYFDISDADFTITAATGNVGLSGTRIVPENSATGTVVGNFSTVFPGATAPFTYSFLGPEGNVGGRFDISGNQLRVLNGALLNYESKTSHVIRIRSLSQDSKIADKVFTISVGNVNETPTNIGLSGSRNVNENASNATEFGTITTVDQDAGNTFTYAFVAPESDAGGRFDVVGAQLGVGNGTLLNYESKKSHQIRLSSTDQGGLSTVKVFTITVLNVNESPTNIGLSGTRSVNENAANGTAIGTFNTIDPDAGETFEYFFIAPDFNAGGRFHVVGSQLQVEDGSLLDYETKTSHKIKVISIDQGGLSVEKTFTIAVNNIAE